MTMPKIDLNSTMFDTPVDPKHLNEIFEILKSEQGAAFEANILIAGLINIEFARGFVTAYMVIRNAMIKKSTDELENIVK